MRKIGYLGFAALMLLLDQASKWAVTEQILRPMIEGPEARPLGFIDWYMNTPARLPFISHELWPVYNVVMVWNTGVSFGLLNRAGDIGPLILTCLSLAISAWFLVWLLKTRSSLQALALSLVIAGALGNVIDRLRFGAVIDFLDFHIAKYHWPAFNIADSCVVCGIFVLIIYSLFIEKNLKEKSLNRDA